MKGKPRRSPVTGQGKKIKLNPSFSRGRRISGPVITASALILFASGFLRGELASLLWGGSLSAVILICWLMVFITAFMNRRAVPAVKYGSDLPFNGAETVPGEEITAAAALEKRVFVLPGIRILYVLDYRFNTRTFTLSSDFQPGGRDFMLSGTPSFRGRYKGSAGLEVRDGAGFFTSFIPLPGSGTLSVFPAPAETPEASGIPAAGGQLVPELRKIRENTELFDTRKFYPGDDPRKLHWKLYAHSGELFLRKGEPVPPPSGLYRIFIDPDLGSLKEGFRECVLEYVLSRSAGFFLELMEEGRGIILGVPGNWSPVFGRDSQQELLSFLSDIWYSSGGTLFTPAGIPADTGVRGTYLLSTPFSGSCADLAAEITAFEGGYEYFRVITPVPAQPDEKKEGIKRLLFHSNTGKSCFPEKLWLEWSRGLEKMKALAGEEFFHVI